DPLEKLSTLLAAVSEADASGHLLEQTVRINFLRNYTVEGIEPFLKYHIYQSGIKPDITFGGYDTIQQELFDPVSHLYQAEPDIVALSLMLEQLDPDCDMPGWTAEGVKERLLELFELASGKTKAL